ncbi:hypothetical protein [Gynuella sp.]|uniref:hypothetical protein n=1 Tax=Gynuella sp. TaxID=2969146 RepID=UPI003D0E1114
MNDYDEIHKYHTDPLSRDTDGDGIEDGTEIDLKLNPLNIDTDGDGLIDCQEGDSVAGQRCPSQYDNLWCQGTDPALFDTDGDQLNDYEECVT